MSITFQVNVYEKTYEKMFRDNYLDKLVQQFNYPFEEKVILIMNVFDRIRVVDIARQNYPDWKVYAINQANKPTCIEEFNLTQEEIAVGYNYSIQHYLAIYLCKTDYLLHWSEDCTVGNIDENFIKDSIDVMEKNNSIICSMPSWDKDNVGARLESVGDIGNFYKAQGFTDQVYFIRTKDFDKDIYHYTHPDSQRYPSYGGEAFEKRIDSYMRCCNKYRIINKNSWYAHKSL